MNGGPRFGATTGVGTQGLSQYFLIQPRTTVHEVTVFSANGEAMVLSFSEEAYSGMS
jgi:hypothetical protein